MSPLQPLQDLATCGMQPAGRLVWIGLGSMPPKRNAIAIDPKALPSDTDCACLAGLDAVLICKGYETAYRTLRTLCGSILAARPRRLQLVDADYKKIAFLKLGGRAC